MTKKRIRKIGNSLGLIIPEDLLAKYHFKEGDPVFFKETPEGLLVSPCDSECEEQEQMNIARKFMDEHKDVLRELSE